jgi:hypothetical protein
LVAASLTAALATTLVFVAFVPSSTAGDEPKPASSPRVVTREYAPPHVRGWGPDRSRADAPRVSANAWRRITAEKAEVGVYIQAYGVIEGGDLDMQVAVAEDLAEFLAQASKRAPAALAPVVTEAVALWRDSPESSFRCRLDLKTGEVEILGSRGGVTIDALEVASALREAIADANALRRAPEPLPRGAK